MTKKPSDKLKAPEHLQPATAEWWLGVMREYTLEPHHVHLLTAAAESWDRYQEAREALAEHGTTFIDRFEQPKARPEIAIERDSRIAFCRTLRELGLDVEEPKEYRPPTIVASRSREAS